MKAPMLAIALQLAWLTPCLAARAVNPDASPDTQRVLDYLTNLPARPQHRVVSGQMLDMADDDRANPKSAENLPGYHQFVEQLAANTGKWVGMIGTNYGRNGGCGNPNPLVPTQRAPFRNCDGTPTDFTRVNSVLIRYWREGGLVTVMWHTPNPWTGATPHDNRVLGTFADLYTPGTPMNATWLKMLDDVAQGLAELQRAGVVVLFRPFHEQNGSWFWWGDHGPGTHPTPAEFTALWRQTFEYLTVTKHLDNLLWVYSVNRDTDGHILVFNPGKSMFDIVGIDDYEDQWPKYIAYDTLKTLGKPMSLAEFSPSPPFAKDPATKGTFDWTRLRDLLYKYPGFCYFTAWLGDATASEALIQNRNYDVLLDDPAIANRGDMDWK